MTLPPDRLHHHRKKTDRATATAPESPLDLPGENTGSWTVDKADHGTAASATSVVTPAQPPELHPGAAAALLKLLTRVHEQGTEEPHQENV